jgi:hypothetical protein
MLNSERLKNLLSYDQDTGVFTWLVNRSKLAKAGYEAGTKKHHTGYKYITIDGKQYNASRLAFLYMTGSFPINEMDHKNRVRDDNRWDNLRESDRLANIINQGMLKNNTSGIKGVSFDKYCNKYRAFINIGKRKFLGRFSDKISAVKERLNAEIKYGYNKWNISSAYKYLKNKGAIC